jgi:hypothetical protein
MADSLERAREVRVAGWSRREKSHAPGTEFRGRVNAQVLRGVAAWRPVRDRRRDSLRPSPQSRRGQGAQEEDCRDAHTPPVTSRTRSIAIAATAPQRRHGHLARRRSWSTSCAFTATPTLASARHHCRSNRGAMALWTTGDGLNGAGRSDRDDRGRQGNRRQLPVLALRASRGRAALMRRTERRRYGTHLRAREACLPPAKKESSTATRQ